MKTDLNAYLGKELKTIASSPLAKAWGKARRSNLGGGNIFLTFDARGISFSAGDEDEVVKTIFLNSDGHEGKRGYSGRLPGGASFKMSREIIRKKFGPPDVVSEGEVVPVLGKMPPTDRYDFPEFSVAFTYWEDAQSIQEIVIMTPDAIPR